MDPVPTRYIDRDGAAFAYQVIGSGPTDLVVMAEAAGHLDLMWSDPCARVPATQSETDQQQAVRSGQRPRCGRPDQD